MTRHLLQKSGRVSFVRRALPKYITYPNQHSQDTYMSKKGLLGPYYNTHHQCKPTISNSSKSQKFTLIQHILKFKILIHEYIMITKPQPSFLLKLGIYDESSHRALHVPENIFPRRGELMLNSGITLNGLLST